LSFGSGGEVVAAVGPLGSAAYAMTIQEASARSRASKIVVAGIADYADESTDFLLARYLS
jgi:nucleoside phosphorylase